MLDIIGTIYALKEFSYSGKTDALKTVTLTPGLWWKTRGCYEST